MIYWDEAALWNFLLDYLLLLCTLRLAGRPIRRGRLAAGAAVGALYALAKLCLPLPTWTLLPALAAMCLLAFGRTEKLLKLTLLFCLLSCALGGGVVLLGTLSGRLYPLLFGVLSARLPWGVFFAASLGCWLLLTFVFRGGARQDSSTTVRVRIRWRGRSAALTLLRDTGNALTDPVTGVGVPVIGADALAPLLTRDERAAIARGEVPGGFTQLRYRAVGVPEGTLSAFRCDEMTADGASLGARLIALSPHPLSDGSGFQGLWCAGEKGDAEINGMETPVR